MGESTSEDTRPDETLGRLREVRLSLLRLHKVLLDAERSDYESTHGRATAGEMLQLVINDPQFAWLRALSELVVQIDEGLDLKEPATAEGAHALLARARELLKPSEGGGEFARRYFAALQREPAAVLAHRETTLLLSEKG